MSARYPWTFLQSPSDPNMVIAGLDDGLMYFKNVNGKWEAIDTVTSYTEQTRRIQYLQGRIWLSTSNRGVFGLHPERLTEDVIHFGPEDGLPESTTIIDEFDGQLILGTKNSLYKVDGDKVVPFTILEDLGVSPRTGLLVHRMATDSKGQLWLVTYNDKKKQFNVGFLSMNKNGQYEWTDSEFALISEDLIHAIYHDKNRLLGWEEARAYSLTHLNLVKSIAHLILSTLLPFETVRTRTRAW